MADRKGLLAQSICLILLAAALLAPPADAATSCEYDAGSETLTVKMSSAGDAAGIAVVAGAIKVSGRGAVEPCSGGAPTLANTESIVFDDNSGPGGTTVSILDPATFAAGGGASITLNPGEGNDALQLFGSSGADHWVIGTGGVDSDDNGSKDIAFSAGGSPEGIVASPAQGNDSVSAEGSEATGAAETAFMQIDGGTGGDSLEGGEARDLIGGGDGNDTVRGRGGDDLLIGDSFFAGDDTLEGGEGVDQLAFDYTSEEGVEVDLAKSGPQETRMGSDTISGIEVVEGSEYGDTLRGDEAANRLIGGPGDDTIEGRGGEDELEGESGIDTLAYADAPSGVTVNLGSGSVSGGGGADTISGFENLTGSGFADALVGSSTRNAISALGGDDQVDVRDSAPDSVSCGTGTDRAVTDRLTVDSVEADCEQVDAIVDAPPPGGGGNAAPADTSVVFRMTGARKQAILRQRAAIVKASCPREGCRVELTASFGKRMRLKRARAHLAAGVTATVRLRLTKAVAHWLRQRLAAGRASKLKVIATATDSAGNSTSAKLTITAKR